MSYFISPREETDLRVDPQWLASSIQRQWQGAELRFPDDPGDNHSVEWTVRREGRHLEGSLDRTCQVIHLVGDVEDCAHFATWYRNVVPLRYSLAFYDEGYSADVELRANTNEAELTEPFLVR